MLVWLKETLSQFSKWTPNLEAPCVSVKLIFLSTLSLRPLMKTIYWARPTRSPVI